MHERLLRRILAQAAGERQQTGRDREDGLTPRLSSSSTKKGSDLWIGGDVSPLQKPRENEAGRRSPEEPPRSIATTLAPS
jgi:hypothetical protein